jgi:hypothetical protein
LIVAITLCCFFLGFVSGESPVSHRFWRTLNERYVPGPHSSALEKAVKSVPPNASVSAVSTAAVHLFKRRELYLFPRPFPKQQPDYVLFDTTHYEKGFEIVNSAFSNKTDKEVKKEFFEIRRAGGYETVFAEDGVYVLRKKTDTK